MGLEDDLQTELRRVLAEEDPLAAMTGLRSFERRLRQWKAAVVARTIAQGASWDDVGKALGTSRQAAWARFKDANGRGEGTVEQSRTELREEIESLRTALRTKERQRRDEAKQLQEQLRSLRERLTVSKRESEKEKRRLNDEIRQKTRLLRDGKVPS